MNMIRGKETAGLGAQRSHFQHPAACAMNLTTIATALNGRFVPIGDHHGFIESSLSIPRDGTLLGAYLFDCGNGQLRITDDGDTLFNVAAAGAIVGSAGQVC